MTDRLAGFRLPARSRLYAGDRRAVLEWHGRALTLGLLAEIQWAWLPALLIGSLIGGYLGAHFAISKGNRWIKRGFEIVTLNVGVKLIMG